MDIKKNWIQNLEFIEDAVGVVLIECTTTIDMKIPSFLAVILIDFAFISLLFIEKS